MLIPKIFIAKPIPKDVEKHIAEYCEYQIWRKEETIPKEVLLDQIHDVTGLMISDGVISKELLESAPKLKIVSNISVGYDSFDIEAMRSRNVIGTNTPFVLDETVADLAIALILSVSRRVVELNQLVKKGKWGKETSDFFGVDVHHRTLGIIGMGRIGDKVARRAKFGFSMDVLYYNRNRRYDLEEKYGVKYTELNSLLEQSDFVLVLLPLKKETQHLIGEEQLSRMKPDSFLINCSRGAIVNEQALIEALQNQKILGAALDVYEKEPLSTDNPLLNMDNVITTPHIGSATIKTRHDMAMKAAQNLVDGVTGKTPPDIVPELKGV